MDRIYTTSKQLLLIASVVILGSVFSLFGSQIGLMANASVDFGHVYVGTFWAFIVFLVFRDHVKDPRIMAALISFNEVFLFGVKLFQQTGSITLVLNLSVFMFFLFMAPALFILRNFNEVFELESSTPKKEPFEIKEADE